MAEDEQGRLWLGTLLGMNNFSGKIGKPMGPVVAAGSRIGNICRGHNGEMWVEAGGRLLRLVDGRITEVLGEEHGVPSDYLGPLLVDRAGTLWFGTVQHGAGFYRDGRIGRLTTESGLPDNRVHWFYEDSGGRLWIATERGVGILRDGRCERAPFSDVSLDGKAVYFVVEDSLHHFWFGTQSGVYEWTGSGFQHFTMRDGLGADFVDHAMAAHDGGLWFGTRGGVSRLDRAGRHYPTPTPAVYLGAVTAGEQNRLLKNGGVVSYTDRSIVFRFNALSFVDEAAMQFQWRMEGLDSGWQPPHKQRRVRYTNLEGGKYVFAVRAANRNGSWSEPVRWSFRVRPPFWKTWRFVALAFIFGGSMLALLYRYRVNQLLKMERMRSRIAADLHDDIASSLASVALYAEVIERQLQHASAEVRSHLGRIRDLSREVMDNIGTIVWVVDPRHDELAELLAYFLRQAGQLCAAAGVVFDSQLPEKVKPIALSPDQRRTIYLILKEGLNNILRHAGSTRVEFICTLRDGIVKLELRDNGRGFESGRAGLRNGGHGLANMEARAAAIGADLQIASEPGRGTTISLRIRMT
jgi:signal transduction histidine kinase